MDAVYEELDEAKAEIEKLKEQHRTKAELAESLKRAHNDQLIKNKESNSKLEKLARALNEKEDEISTARQMYEEAKSNLDEKQSIIKHLSSAHEKLRLDCNEKLRICEEENKELALALDESNAKNIDQEQKICALEREIEGVKRLLTSSDNKCSECEKKTKTSNESEVRDDDFLKLEDEKRKFRDELKWKKEQFVHLEEAHRKLRNEFKSKENGWEKEKIELLNGISSLQSNLESQTRMSQDLQHRLEMCNNALAHAESKRKQLEVQLAETRSSYDSVCVEFDEAKLNFENLAAQRDGEIASLRSSLGTKEMLYKEMEYQFRKTERENRELLISLKELQEDQIREAGLSYSSSKLQNKLKSLEKEHKGCSTNLRAKECEWRSEMEKLSKELRNKDKSLSELNKELEARSSLILELELLNHETSLILLILKSEFLVARADNKSCMALKNNEVDKNMCSIVEELEKKNSAFKIVQKDLDDEREKVVVLSEKVQMLEALQFPLKKEVERLKIMLEESKTCRVQSEEHVVQIQSHLRKDLDDEREKVVVLSEKVQVLEALLFPLREEVERLKIMLEESNTRRVQSEEHVAQIQSDLEKANEEVERLKIMLEESKKCRVQSEEHVVQIQNDLIKAHEEVERLKIMLDESKTSRVQSEEHVVQIQSDLIKAHEEVERLKIILDESKTRRVQSEEHVVQIQSDLRQAHEELYEKFHEANEIEFELQIWKSIADQLEVNLKQHVQMRRELEASLFAQMEVEMNLKQENEILSHELEEKDKQINDLKLQAEALVWEEEEKNNESTPQTTERIYQLVEEKDQRIYDLQQLVDSLEKEFESSTKSFSTKLSKMQKERNVLRESWEKVKSDDVLKETDIQVKNIVIMELENDLFDLRERLDEQDRASYNSKKKMQEIQAELEKKECELETKIKNSAKTIKSLSSENKKLANTIGLLSEKMEQFAVEEDLKLMESLGKIVEAFDVSGADEKEESVKENVNIINLSSSSPLMKKVEAIHDERSPFRTINS